MTHERADLERISAITDLREATDGIEVDEMARPCEAKRHHGHEALAACDDADIFIRKARQQYHRLIECCRAMERKGRGLQRCSFYA